MRLTGKAYWVERSDWIGIVDYEARVSKTFAGRNIIGMCSSCLDRYPPHEVLDVVANHEFARARGSGGWQMIRPGTRTCPGPLTVGR
ncbi:MEDS domain-containing protein [Myxococcus sp. SDU36]|uniref:MEDS domain-containing protein n=1 Tax=Myxococcus sp. SDU36 TaxID=2831967 RepID=UPI0032F0269A